ncbi:MAG: hypothetical protein ABI868_17655 [Acidobacteriota bacterium]
MMRRRLVLIAAFAGLATLGVWFSSRTHVAAQSLPAAVSDKDFWAMVVGFSEPGGFFRSDNLISNETAFQHVIPQLQQIPQPGAYIGVGPDQNFTYIVALKPRIAFITDIRRQNMLLHLMYKALVELSADRADFLSRLFARPRPTGISPGLGAQALFDAFETMVGSEELAQQHLRAVFDHLERTHGFALSDEDETAIRFVYRSFSMGGPDIRYSFPRSDLVGGQWFPTYAELMVQTDLRGINHSYLASEENFNVLKDYHTRNLIIPLVGDFAGERTLRTVGQYLKSHDATVTAFYTSNVEQYLFQGDGWRKFFLNVSMMPTDEHSTFIRAYFNRMGYRFQAPGTGLQSSTLLDPIGRLVAAFSNGDIRTYYDVVSRSK